MTPTAQKLVDFVMLQTGWFACVMGGAAGNDWLGPLSVVTFVTVHLVWVVGPGRRGAELRNVLLFGALGCVIDAIQVGLGVMCFPPSSISLAGLPIWLMTLWFLFPILFNTAFTWLHGRPLLAAAMALIGSPLTYAGGERLGGVTLGSDRWLALGSLGAFWAVYLPLSIALGRQRTDS